jgi:hypothetical protein
MGRELVGLVCGCGGGLAVLLVAALLLRLSVSVANRVIGPAKAPARARAGRIAEWDWDDWDDEDAYPGPADSARGPNVIPEPGIVKCGAIVFLTAFVALLGFVLLGFVAEELGLRMRRGDTRTAVAIFDLPVVGLTLSVLLVATLPTTFWRAALVAFLYGLIVVVTGVTIACALFVLRMLVGL